MTDRSVWTVAITLKLIKPLGPKKCISIQSRQVIYLNPGGGIYKAENFVFLTSLLSALVALTGFTTFSIIEITQLSLPGSGVHKQ